MTKDIKVLAIIPARGGSKRLPNKNIKPLLGKPLIAYSIEQALQSKYIHEVFVSTDSQEIADVSEKFGVSVPSLRPDSLSTDASPSSEFVLYTIDLLKKQGKEFDYIVLLEPTSPLRKADDIDNAIELMLENNQKDGVVSVGEVHMEHPMIVKKIDDNNSLQSYIDNVEKITQSQMADKAYFPYGVIYLIKTSVFLDKKSFYTDNIIPYHIERWQNYEIDDIYDFICVENILKYQNSL